MNVKDYIRKVNYHETDKMGITHHSNYIKWMEEARFDYLEQLNCGYEKLERQGIISPVTATAILIFFSSLMISGFYIFQHSH